MESLCESTFLDWNVTWNTDSPDFTLCFQKTILVWVPCAFLWIFSPLNVHYLRKSEHKRIPFNVFNVTKLVLIMIAITLKLAEAVLNFWTRNFQPVAYFSSIILIFFTLVLYFILTLANIKRGIRSSGILFIFSLLCVICEIPEIMAIIKNLENSGNFIKNDIENTCCISYYVIMVITFIMNCFADQRSHSHEKGDCPSKRASFLSKLFLMWFDRFIWKNHKQVVTSMLWNLDTRNETKNVSRRSKWKSMKNGTKEISILGLLRTEYGYLFWTCVMLRTTIEVLSTGLYIILDWLLRDLQTNEETWKAYFYTGLFFTNLLLQSALMTKYTENCCRMEIQVRSTLISCLYEKVLHMSNAARKEFPTSDIVDLMSIDTTQLQNSLKICHHLIALIIQMVTSYLYLWYLLGDSVVTSVLVIMTIFAAGYHLNKRMKILQNEEKENKNARSKFMQDIISGIKVLKMYAWERSFLKVAMNLRQTENKTLKKIAFVNILFQNLLQNSPFVSFSVTYISYILLSKHLVLNIRTAFVSLAVFNYFGIAFNRVPQYVLNLQQVKISVKRINQFLRCEGLDDSAVSHDRTIERLIMREASFSWVGKDGPTMLENINVKIDDSSLVAIVGPVGAGKSSLISAFLGEMYKTSGYVNTNGTTAYVPQQPWILNISIKRNITLNEDIDQKTYQKVIEVCALNSDIKQLKYGDATEIGEKGVNLSGGQKQRISLARAVCQNADIYFLDDPLSAVDSYVADHIFQNVFGPKGFLKDKTRILVTHNTKFLPFMDKIIVLEDGRVSATTYRELLNNGQSSSDFVRSLLQFENGLEESNSKIDERKIIPERRHTRPSFDPRKNSKAIGSKLIHDEILKSEQMDRKSYWIYFKAAGLLLSFVALIMFVLYQMMKISASLLLSNWITSDDAIQTKNSFLITFAACVIIQILLISVGSYISFMNTVKAGAYFYENLLRNIMHWPMSSFDSTPVGRIITRISDDVYTLDNLIAIKMVSLLFPFIRYISIFILTIVTIPISSAVIIPLNIIYLILRKYYVALSHQLKRIESIHKSPFYSHIVETISGMQTIRAHKLQKKFTDRCYERNDSYCNAHHVSSICTRWFCCRVELLEALLLCAMVTLVIFHRDSLTLGYIGLEMTFAMQMIRGVTYISETFNDIEDGIMCVERISEYIDAAPEPDWDKSSVTVPETWPQRGQITFCDFKLRYRPNADLVLRGISLTIQSGEKVGIVGRTGAGKTSVIQGLFRITEPDDGTIIIDDIDITKVALQTLRSRLTVIPQDPVLFYGSLRFNLDPFDDYSDEYLWNILSKSHLKKFLQELPLGLNYMIEEGGRNLSFGQRQLICLARALLRKSKILVLDEATASVDVKTDELIQKTIREEFSHCTVITIAHRINTLQDYDKIALMEKGLVVKFDSPENLLNSKFSHVLLESEST